MEEFAQIEMPRYQSHKKVWALQIKEITGFPNHEEEDSGKRKLSFYRANYAPIEVDVKLYEKHKPEKDWYYVVYEGGYKSFSPQEAFENGNTEIKEK